MKRSAAIMFTDIVGYSSLMNKDEGEAMVLVEKNRAIHLKQISNHGGAFIKEMGDGIIASFDSVSSAVDCGLEIIRHADGYKIKVGINHGEVSFENNDVFGDPVNIAARIEAIGSGGSILISGLANAMLSNNKNIQTRALGKYHLKNIDEPVEIYAIEHAELHVPEPGEISSKAKEFGKDIFNNLPKVETSFIGRKVQIAQIEDLLKEKNLITLYGSGGSGKTRLAIEYARQNLSEYVDGVFFVDLATITNENLVADVVAGVLSVSEEPGVDIKDSILGALRKKNRLVIFDNCEHVIESAATLLDKLSRSGISAKLMVTSRELLNIQNEQSFLVPTLSLASTDTELGIYSEAAELFTSRAKRVRPDFELDSENSEIIETICQKLDGIPLALELAASRTNLMDTRTLLGRLDKHLGFLKTSDRSIDTRHKTIEATIDWSHQLLSEEEQILFKRLSVFSGDFGLEQAEKICGYAPLEEWEVIDIMSQLVNKSLIVPVESSRKNVRYRLLELMKQYGQSKLLDDRQELEEKLITYYRELATQSFPQRISHNEHWRNKLKLEQDNIIGILNLIKDDPEKTLQFAFHYLWYFMDQDWLTIAWEYLRVALERYPKEDLIKGATFCYLASIIARGGNIKPEVANRYANEGIKILKNVEDSSEKADAVLQTSLVYFFLGQFEESKQSLDFGEKILEKFPDPFWEMRIGAFKGAYYLYKFDLETAEPIINTTLELAKKNNSPWDITINSHLYADIPLVRGDYVESEKRYRNAINVCMQSQNIYQATLELQGLAMSLCGQGRIEKGIKVWGGMMKKQEEINRTLSEVKFWNTMKERTIYKAMTEVGDGKSGELLQAGRLLSFEQLLEYAFDLEKE